MPKATQPSSSSVGRALKTLRRITILKDLPPEVVERLESACRWREYQANEQVFDSDDRSGEVYFVIRGSVRVVNYSAPGRQVGIADCDAGGFFGELSALDGEARSATVFAQKMTVLAIVDRSTFVELLKQYPHVSLRLLAHLAGVIRAINDRILDLSALSDVQRVYYKLLRLAEPDPEGDGGWVIFKVPRHKDLADLVGTTPEIVSHAISQLMKAELVKRRSGNLVLLNKTGVQQLALMG